MKASYYFYFLFFKENGKSFKPVWSHNIKNDSISFPETSCRISLWPHSVRSYIRGHAGTQMNKNRISSKGLWFDFLFT